MSITKEEVRRIVREELERYGERNNINRAFDRKIRNLNSDLKDVIRGKNPRKHNQTEHKSPEES